MKFIRILLVEDSGVELNEITGAFVEASAITSSDCKVERAKNKVTATALSQQFHYHLVSLDQNIPLNDDPNTSTILGFELAEELARQNKCFYGAIYTNVPEKDKMVSLINTGFQYREKGVVTDVKSNCFTYQDYCKVAYEETLDLYPLRVLEKLRDGGFSYISTHAGTLAPLYKQFIAHRNDRACKDFFVDFFAFFEHSLILVCDLVGSIAKSLGVGIDGLPVYRGDGSPSPAVMIDWLREALSNLRSNSLEFLNFEHFFCDGSQHEDLSAYLVDASFEFKEFRNRKIHEKLGFSLDDYDLISPYVFRILDFLSIFASANVIFQPRRIGKSWVFDCTQLNDRFPSTQQIEFDEGDFKTVGVDGLSPKAVLINVPTIGFIELSSNYTVRRDENTRVQKLEFSPWYSK